jgi:hypothetical protein
MTTWSQTSKVLAFSGISKAIQYNSRHIQVPVQTEIQDVGFVVVMAVTMKSIIFWDVILCSLVEVY